jgi:ketosteroid isomerase-like protein
VLLEDGDRVAVLGWYTGTYKETGRSFRARFTHWWKVSDGKLSGFELVVDSVKMQEAMSAR